MASGSPQSEAARHRPALLQRPTAMADVVAMTTTGRLLALRLGLLLLGVVFVWGQAAEARADLQLQLQLRGGLKGEDVRGLQRDEAAGVCGPQLTFETPSCTVVSQRDGYELRHYPDGQIWVETLVAESSYAKALVLGFYRCFYYISGKNSRGEIIEMTGPVLIIPAPEASGWRIAFFAPSRFGSVKDLPTPTDSALYFHEREGSTHAVIGPFGGFPDQDDYSAVWLQLKARLDRDGVVYDESTVTYEGYSSPFEFKDRKQEVHVVVASTSQTL